MKQTVPFVAVFLCAATYLAAQKSTFPVEIKSYELYSWQDAKGEWDYSLFPAVSNAGLSPGFVMKKESALKGTPALKQALAKIPVGSEIIWLDRTLGVYKDAKESAALKYPPAEIIAEIRRYCESRQFKLLVESPKQLEK